jgi:hypothetical protein
MFTMSILYACAAGNHFKVAAHATCGVPYYVLRKFGDNPSTDKQMHRMFPPSLERIS